MPAHFWLRRLYWVAALILPAGGVCIDIVRAAENEKPSTMEVESAKLSFNRDIRPILSEACFRCHGPDAAARAAELRLDLREGATADLSGHAAVVPGRPEQSELVTRIMSTDPDVRMPPAEAEHQLTDDQVAKLRRWIAEGAEYESHWSLLPPVRHEPPAIQNKDWPRNPIDNFVAGRLEREGLKPSPEANKVALLRRLTVDLTGLPPTPQEIDAFLADRSPNAYEKVVDRLLASPRYGERMASFWLDAARYADTNGYQSDGKRFMWRWRDWVIESFNKNQPFDEFTVEQLAGDLLPNPTLDQLIATGFNRNHRGNEEGGIIAEEFRVEYVADRVETTSTVWLGLTVGCARCHDHKYDPITQKDFYRLFAFFNNINEPGKAVRDNNSPPLIKAPTREMQHSLAEKDRAIQAAHAACERVEPQLRREQEAWERELARGPTFEWPIRDALVLHYPLDGHLQPAKHAAPGGKPATSADGKVTPVVPAATFEGGVSPFAAGMRGQAAEFDGKRQIRIDGAPEISEATKYTLAAWIKPAVGKGRSAILARADADNSYLGYALFWNDGKLQFDFVNRIDDDALKVETAERLQPGRWLHVAATYDGSRTARGMTIYVDGVAVRSKILADTLSNPIRPDAPLLIGSYAGDDRFRGTIDDVRLYTRVLAAAELATLGGARTLDQSARTPSEKRSPSDNETLRAYFLRFVAKGAVKNAYDRRAAAEAERAAMEATIPTTMVMEEMPEPRPTFVLTRGQYDLPGERVSADVPASLPALPSDAPRNRLGFARWLVDGKHPLTARVAVNRFWQLYFGRGLVETTEDFGSQGQWPTHPELLDWLAEEFVRTGWDVKRLQKTIVSSATYRQDSSVTQTLVQRDPDNRLLARGPRFRLSAEAIRDQALAVSGLLTEKLGGPSIMPYQPEGLWEELTHTAKYKQDHGEDLYRRSLYVYWRRTIPPPGMSNFDAAAREICTVRQVRTNTPLQALTLLNDITYVEAARALAQRVRREAGSDPEKQIALAFRLATSRVPTAAELKLLLAGYERYRERYVEDTAAAEKLLKVGEAPVDMQCDPAALAAATLTCSVILNLDETVTKQ